MSMLRDFKTREVLVSLDALRIYKHAAFVVLIDLLMLPSDCYRSNACRLTAKAFV